MDIFRDDANAIPEEPMNIDDYIPSEEQGGI